MNDVDIALEAIIDAIDAYRLLPESERSTFNARLRYCYDNKAWVPDLIFALDASAPRKEKTDAS